MFFKRWVCEEVLLPANATTGIDFDLLLINKERKITPQLKIVLKDYRKFKCTKWDYLGDSQKNLLIKEKSKETLR